MISSELDLLKSEPVFIALKYVDLFNHVLSRNRKSPLPVCTKSSRRFKSAVDDDWCLPGDCELSVFRGFGCFVLLGVVEDQEGKPEGLHASARWSVPHSPIFKRYL